MFLVFGWFQNMTSIAGLLTWFGICIVRVHPDCSQAPGASMMTRFCNADLPPIPSWLESSRARPKPSPVQILPPTLRGVVWPRHNLSNPSPQWLLRIPPRELGHGGLRDELHTIDICSDIVWRREFRDEEQVRESRGHGFRYGVGRSDCGFVR